jgi:hypothetical protein
MAQEVNMAKAREVFAEIVNMLDTRDWKYEKFEDDLLIRSGIKGDDLPVEFILFIKPENQVVQFISKLPFNMPDDKRVEGAIAVSVANYGLVDGSLTMISTTERFVTDLPQATVTVISATISLSI